MSRAILRGIAALFLVLFVALPVGTLFGSALSEGPRELLRVMTSRVAEHALWLTIWTALVVTIANAILGTLTAWVLVRHHFPGRALLDAAIDLPFSIPTIVTGLMIVVLYGPGGLVSSRRVLFHPLGILIALAFVTFPLVVRAVQPVLRELETDQEEAAFTLGAWPYATFRRVILPAIAPAVLTGALLTFARALGEFGTVVIVAGNLPRRTLTAPVYIFGAIEGGQPHAASAMSALLVVLSFALIFTVDRYTQRRRERVS